MKLGKFEKRSKENGYLQRMNKEAFMHSKHSRIELSRLLSMALSVVIVVITLSVHFIARSEDDNVEIFDAETAAVQMMKTEEAETTTKVKFLSEVGVQKKINILNLEAKTKEETETECAELNFGGVGHDKTAQISTEDISTSFPDPNHETVLREVCFEKNVPYEIAMALIWHESRFNPYVVNSISGCYGYCQLHPRYFPNWLSPEDNIRYGIGWLGELYAKHGDIGTALTVYAIGHDNGSRTFANEIFELSKNWGY